MYIIGTSGHIDHGKTSLIHALTGIDADRLPEEKQRGMTIDIGFAHIEYPRFGTVSIIDVPGHERFIRNMVVGAWGVDVALLVVAVDDGWMPQTEDHFRVLQLLGIERIIGVLTKVDLVDDETRELAEEELREHLAEGGYEDADIVAASSMTGEGIDALRELIVVNLRRLNKAVDTDRSYLFVDRAFSPKGQGTVITGTLKNGRFTEEEQVTVLPGNKKARIKRIESHYNELQEGAPSQRTALNLAGVTLDDISRGYIVVRHSFFVESREIIAAFRMVKDKKLKNNQFVEILIGTHAFTAKLIVMDDDHNDAALRYLRLQLQEPWVFYSGQPFIITTPGGYRILGGGTVLVPNYDKGMKKWIQTHRDQLPGRDVEKLPQFLVSLYGALQFDTLFTMMPLSKKKLERILKTALEDEELIHMDTWYLDNEYFSRATGALAASLRRPTGIALKQLAHEAGISEELTSLLLRHLKSEIPFVEKDGRFFSGNAVTEENMTDNQRRLLGLLKQNGGQGFELQKQKSAADREDLKVLLALGFARSLDGSLIYHHETYHDLSARIMKLFDTNEKITVPDAKEVTDLSRKYIIPLLNAMESDGLIRRLGDFRIKA